MIPLLYEKDGTTKIGELTNCIECLVEEERNGIFEVSIVYPTTDFIFNSLKEENIIICDANDTLKAQKFRIYMTRKLMSNKIEVYARHISFDLAYDTVDNIDITNQSCEYALNTIFRQSQFSTHYRGYSDIVNAQNYKMSMANCIEAIAGKEGSIIDTFGTGAEIFRDNTNIHVLNKRGHDNEVSIEYAKNLTGFELEEDYSELVTRINAYAKYTNSETNKEVLVEAKGIDSPLITNYSHPYVAYIDYSDQFENEEVPTKEKLIELAKKEYSINNKDKPKQNYKIEFVPLSKCVGYEGLEDKISLCDTVTIKDTRYGIDTKSKVIRTVYDVLKNRYDSMELGEPRTTLGDIIGGSGEDGEVGPPGPQGPPGADGNIGDFPNSLPITPILTYNLYGYNTIELSWTYENKVYYSYELYASKAKDFTPNVFDLIHAGQSSSFLFQAKPNETWYFRVCCVNSHGNRTEFSSQVVVTTKKIDDLSNYVDNMAINDALIGTLSLDRGWVGQLRGNWIDAKQLSVTDGNGKRTLDIDSFGNVSLDVSTLKISSESVATKNDLTGKVDTNKVISSINQTSESVKIKANKIQLNGATTIGDGISRYVGINNGDYTLYESGKVRGFFGYKKLTDYDSDDIIPRLTLTHYGLDAKSNSYFTMFPYPADTNPQGTPYPYMDMAYCCPGHQRDDGKGGTIGDYSNIKMFGNGDIKIAPVGKLEITSNYINGEYPSNSTGYEKNIATFLSSSSQYYDSCLEIKAVRKWGGAAGLVLAHYNDNDVGTLVRVNTDESGGKYFRPVTTNAEVQLGSGNYRWHTVFAKNALNASSDRTLKENIKYIEEVPNVKAATTNEITTKDMYDFVNNDLYIAKYNFIGDNNNKYGFIAQDIVDTKVGSEIITCDRENNDTLGYDTSNYTNVLAGALKEAINEIEKLKEEIKALKGGA